MKGKWRGAHTAAAGPSDRRTLCTDGRPVVLCHAANSARRLLLGAGGAALQDPCRHKGRERERKLGRRLLYIEGQAEGLNLLP